MTDKRTATEKIADYLARDAIRLSRKYRHIGVPPQLEDGQTYLDILRAKYPRDWERYERFARETIVHRDRSTHIELSVAEFDEWLRQKSSPPAPFNTWREYWDAERGKGSGAP